MMTLMRTCEAETEGLPGEDKERIVRLIRHLAKQILIAWSLDGIFVGHEDSL